MKTVKELFELEAKKYEDCDLSKNEDGSYKSDLTHTCFYWWCKSAQREGYKLVPIEPTEEMLDAARRRQWDDLSSPLEDMDTLKYKAMIGAIE